MYAKLITPEKGDVEPDGVCWGLGAFPKSWPCDCSLGGLPLPYCNPYGGAP